MLALWIFLGVLGLISVVVTIVLFTVLPIKHYIKMNRCGVKCTMKDILKVKNSRFSMDEILDTYVCARRAGFKVTIDDVLSHREAGGNLQNVVKACVSAKSSNIDLSFQLAKALDLSGRDVLEAVRNCLAPKTVETNEIVAISKDGIECKLRVKVTLRTNIKRFLGGADENTVISRIEEAVSSAVGSSNKHGDVVENPDAISDYVLSKDLDSASMYEILSVDVVSCTVGSNVALRLEAEKAEQNKRIAIAKAEEQHQTLINKEQEMKVKTQELKAEVARQEAEVPKALVKALKEGKLSTMDYLNMENIKSDTKMRKAITESSMKNIEFDDDDFDF